MNPGMPDRASWNDFPEVLIHASESTVKKHPDYPAAKAGDIRAAKLLVVATLNDRLVATIKEQLGGSNALLVPVHAYEATGINRIPAVLAEVLGERLSLKVAVDIIQVNRVGHTGASGYHRLAFQALFDGEVERDRDYVLVDDFVGQGGTLANLRGYIESRGGVAVLSSTLTGKPYSARLALTRDTLLKLSQRYGQELENWWKETLGFGFDKLTESEARYLERADNADAIRSRILAARLEKDDQGG